MESIYIVAAASMACQQDQTVKDYYWLWALIPVAGEQMAKKNDWKLPDAFIWACNAELQFSVLFCCISAQYDY